MSELTNLGCLVSSYTENRRDAVHVAVVAVTANEDMEPSTPVKIVDETLAVRTARATSHGIVDPFLPGVVRKGSKFWVVMNPGTITSLRHEWTHPAFKSNEKEAAEIWLRKWAEDRNLEFEQLMTILEDAVTGDAYVGHDNGDDIAEDLRYDLVDISARFFLLTGMLIDKNTYFPVAVERTIYRG